MFFSFFIFYFSFSFWIETIDVGGAEGAVSNPGKGHKNFAL
jgi:hypothetical protein